MNLLLTITSAVLFALAFPPLRLRPLAWLAMAPWLLALRRSSARGALALAWVWTVVAAWGIGDWLPRAVSTYYEQPRVVGAAFFVGVSTATAAAYYMAFALAYRRLAGRLGALGPLAAAAAWVAAELGRGRLLTGSAFFIGNPWGLLGYSQVGFDTLVQVAATTGVYGISFVLMAVNAAAVEAWVLRRAAAATLVVGALPAVAALAYGGAALRAARAAPPSPATPIAVVQGNLDLGSQWRPEFYGRNLDVYLRLTRDAIERSRPAIVFWPEGAMTFFLAGEPLYRAAIARVVGPAGVELVAGGPRRADGTDDVFYNSIFLLDPTGDVRARYDKQYLVPFAEYFPFARLDLLRRRFARVRVFTPGGKAALLPTAAGPAGVVNCNEAMLPEVVGARVAAGAAYLVNPSNDSWLQDAKYSALQLDIVTLRALEQRRWLVRASTSGPSAVIDPWGRVQAESAPLAQQVIAGSVRPRADRTVYGRIGDAFAALCLVAALVALAAGRRGAEARDATR